MFPAGFFAANLVGLLSIGLALTQSPLIAQDQPLETTQAVAKLRDLNSYFPFEPPESLANWDARKIQLRRHLQVALGLWPFPSQREPVNATIHGLSDRGDYTIEKVFFDGGHGLHVTGTLYRPKHVSGKVPGILTPHGHFRLGRFGGQSEEEIQREIDSGGETFRSNSRSVLQARSANLAKMGCVVFLYDMLGFADSQQIGPDVAHQFAKQRSEMSGPSEWGLFSPQAESNLQHVMGLQTWNSIRALDFLESLPEVDATRIGVTGASGGGTQTFVLCAIDDRPAAAFPAVMVSTAMQGGCTCENCCYLRIGTGNVEIAALFAPKPMGLTAANDWTREMAIKGYPQLEAVYALYGKPANVELNARLEFGHNYNQVSREAMYRWFKKHLKFAGEPVETEITYVDPKQLSVYDETHPRPAGGPAFEKQYLKRRAMENLDLLNQTLLTDPTQPEDFETLIGGFVDVVYDSAEESMGSGKLSSNEATVELLGHQANVTTIRHEQIGVDHRSLQVGEGDSELLLLNANGLEEFEATDDLSQLAQSLIAEGVSVRVFDNRIALGESKKQTRRVDNPRESLSYTLGYNAPQLANRANAWKDLIGLSQSGAQQFIVGLDRTGLEVALNAHRISNVDSVAGIVINTHGFRFQQLDDIRAPDMLPGAAKYLDLPGLLTLAAPKPMLLIGEDERSAAAVVRAYQVAGNPDALTLMSSIPSGTSERDVITEWIKSKLAK